MKKLLKLALLLAVVVGIARIVMMKQEWSGLSEAQVRDKLDAGLSRKVDDADKRQEIADKVVTAMKDKGVIREDAAVDAGADAAAEAGGEAAADIAPPADTPEIQEAG